jgi:pimeloyl-ACP methyl ester carboxylesterase
MKRIEMLKQEEKVSYHVLERAGHWVHSDNPIGLINILHDELVKAENNR